MDRRSAMWIGVAALLGACGGGGGSTSAVAIDPTAQSANSAASSNVACWGDSLTPAFALNLQLLVPGRTVFVGGFLGQGSTYITAQQLADSTMTNWINVFWEGHNDVTQPDTVKANIATSIAHLA